MGRLGGRAGNDQRRARLVDEDGVHLVDNCEVVTALDLLVLGGGHAVVAEVVEAEFGVGAVGDIARILGAALPGRHLVLDGADRQTEVTEQRPHPLGVAFGEIVIHGDDMHAEAGQGV